MLVNKASWRWIDGEVGEGQDGVMFVAGITSPDVLWVVTTQWRGQAWGGAGDGDARTGWVDAWAERAVNYVQAVTPHPFGPFARAAMLTGRRCPENGVKDYYDPLPEGTRTVAGVMGERGYETGYFGKWHLSEKDSEAPLVGEVHARTVVRPEARGGFGFWEGFEGGFLLNDPWLHGTRWAEPTRVEGYQSEVVCGRAGAWLAGRTAAGAGPWMAVVSVEAPHPPYDAATPVGVVRPEGAGLTLRGNVPRGGGVEVKARRELAGYYAHIEATDRAVGRLVTEVERAAEAAGRRRPVVVFTSVHGDMHGSHGLFRKGWPHEESVRVPLLVSGAPEEEGGRRSDEVVSLLDLMEMTVAWSEGRGWRSRRERAEISMPSVVRLPHQCDRVWQGWRSATRKEIFLEDGRRWFEVDLETDPLECDGWGGAA